MAISPALASPSTALVAAAVDEAPASVAFAPAAAASAPAAVPSASAALVSSDGDPTTVIPLDALTAHIAASVALWALSLALSDADIFVGCSTHGFWGVRLYTGNVTLAEPPIGAETNERGGSCGGVFTGAPIPVA